MIDTYSMVQCPSWEANWFAASQEIPRISRNPKVHYRTHKSPPSVSILGQPNPVHTPTSHLLEIHPNIIHPSTPRSPQWSPPFRFSQQESNTPLSSPMRATCPAHIRECVEKLRPRCWPEETTICYKISLVQWLITNLNVILYLSTCHTVHISVLILFMIML